MYQESTSNYAAIDQYTCKTTGQANQEWRWNPVLGGYGQLQSQYSGKDLVVTNASTAAGAKIVQYDQNGTANGLWKPIRLADGSWQFQNLNSGQCLDVPGASMSRGVQLIQWPCSSSPLATGNQAFADKIDHDRSVTMRPVCGTTAVVRHTGPHRPGLRATSGLRRDEAGAMPGVTLTPRPPLLERSEAIRQTASCRPRAGRRLVVPPPIVTRMDPERPVSQGAVVDPHSRPPARSACRSP